MKHLWAELVYRLQQSRAIVLSLGVVLLCLSVLLIGDLFNLRDSGAQAYGTARQVIAEAMSIQLSTLASTADSDAVSSAVAQWVQRQPLLAGARLVMPSVDGPVWHLADSRPQARQVLDVEDGVKIEIYRGDRQWAEVTVWFSRASTLLDTLRYYAYTGLVLLLCQLAYLSKVLVQLDPAKAIPERVNSAFNMLSEGVVILDLKYRVLMANSSGVAITGRNLDRIVGSRIDAWPWVRDSEWQAPWATAMNTGNTINATMRILLEEPRSFAVCCTLIRNDDHELSGIMVTLDDITAIERKNRELSGTLHSLRRSQASIQEKNRELKALAMQDPLTGLNNRRAVLERFADELDNAHRDDSAIACIMVDIDYFKSINDTLGHAVGDEVICAVANTLSLGARGEHAVGRIGGEEFVVVLPGLEAPSAAAVAETIRHSISLLANDVTIPVDRLTASLGVASRIDDACTVERLLDESDQALYRAKNTGRNRVVRFDQLDDSIAPAQPENDADAAGIPEPDEVVALQRQLRDQSTDLERLRYFDTVTGFPKRELFLNRLAQHIDSARRADQMMAVLSISLRGISPLEASLGHEMTDGVAREFSQRLRDGLRRADCVTEIAPDQPVSRINDTAFGVILGNIENTDSVLAVMTRIRSLMAPPMAFENHSIHAGCSIGASVFPDHGQSPDELLREAISARTETTQQVGKFTFSFASEGLNEHSQQALEIESDLYDAVNEYDFTINYQPKLNLATQRIESLEALIRWQHPTKGWISPDTFIPMAEANGLISEISAFVMRTGFAQLKHWHEAGFRPLRLSVNISGTQLKDPEIVNTILEAIQDSGLSPHDVDIELTETAVIESPQRARVALGQLQKAGVAISMDDFGTGYTSLALLADLPLDFVKIDRSFVSAMGSNERSRAIVESIINMAHTLRLSVVGEGVETNDQLTTLADLGCNEIQGYLISRPLSPEDLSDFLIGQARDFRRKSA